MSKRNLTGNILLPLVVLIMLCGTVSGQGNDFRLRLNQLEKDYTTRDIQAEVSFGRDLAAKVLQKYKLHPNRNLQKYVNLLGNGIVSQIGRAELNFHFAVIEADDVNAYACPGGYIFVTKGAVRAMANEAQLVGVLAHEIVHINRRHIVKQLKIRAEDDGPTSGIAAMFGSTSATARILLDQLTEQAFALLFEEGVSRESEYEADREAIEIMAAIQYDWASYRDYLRSMDSLLEQGQGRVVSQTHPGISDRLGRIEQSIETFELKHTTGKRNAKRFKHYQLLL